MFPSTPDRASRATAPAWSKLRNAASLVIAFMTLDSYGIDDLRRGRAAGLQAPAGTSGEPTTSPGPSASSSRHAAAAGPDRPPAAHHHRRALRPPIGPRRAGGITPPDQLCLTPVGSQERSAAGSHRLLIGRP